MSNPASKIYYRYSHLIISDPLLHLLPHPGQVVSQSGVDAGGQDLGQVETPGQELTRGERCDGVGISQVKLKIHLIRILKQNKVFIMSVLSMKKSHLESLLSIV